MKRRDFLGATAVAVVGSTAGCSALPFVGDDPIEFEASRATVPGSVRDETGYEEHEVVSNVIERTYEVGGQTQNVLVTNWQAKYDKAIEPGGENLPVEERIRAAVFTVLSTPQVSVLGQSFNPVEDMSTRELAEMVGDRFDSIDNLEQVGESAALVAGQETTAGDFTADAELADTDFTVELNLHITEAVEAGDDFLVTVGAYPRRVRDIEEDNVFTMMESVDHEG